MIPFPNEPKVHKADAKLFSELFAYVEARRSRTRKGCREPALVLAAAGIPHELYREQGQWVVLVHAEDGHLYLVTGFSMGLLGHAVAGWIWLVQIADWGGAYVVSALLMLCSAALAIPRWPCAACGWRTASTSVWIRA